MKVTTKGQVTIPQEIRDELGIQPGSEVEFQIDGSVVRLIPVRGSEGRGGKLVESLRGRATVRLTTEEIMSMTRGRR